MINFKFRIKRFFICFVSDYGIPFWLGGQKNARGKWRWEWTETRVPTRAVKWGWAQVGLKSVADLSCFSEGAQLFLHLLIYCSRSFSGSFSDFGTF